VLTAGGSEAGQGHGAVAAAVIDGVRGVGANLEIEGGTEMDTGSELDGELDGAPFAADASAVLEVLAAADVLGIESLRDACESLLTPSVDAATALPLLG
jgi:hypothetical protein